MFMGTFIKISMCAIENLDQSTCGSRLAFFPQFFVREGKTPNKTVRVHMRFQNAELFKDTSADTEM